MKQQGKTACVLGQNITYSRSPLIHGFWIKKYGLDASYTICDLKAGHIKQLMDDIRNGKMAGCNVTVPYKQEVIQYLDALDEPARITGSVNTIYTKDGQLRGTSTDGAGYVSHLKATYPDFAIETSSILILGAGGAARSIAMALIADGCGSIHLTNRTSGKAVALSELSPDKIKAINWDQRFDAAKDADLVVNTTTLGMRGRPVLDFEVQLTKPGCIISDIVYAPLETKLLASARTLRRPTLDGLGMLLHQAAPGFQLWFGKRPEVTPDLRQLIEKDLIDNG